MGKQRPAHGAIVPDLPRAGLVRLLGDHRVCWTGRGPDCLSMGRVRSPSRLVAAGASCFVGTAGVSVSAKRAQTDMRGLVTAGRVSQERERSGAQPLIDEQSRRTV